MKPIIIVWEVNRIPRSAQEKLGITAGIAKAAVDESRRVVSYTKIYDLLLRSKQKNTSQ